MIDHGAEFLRLSRSMGWAPTELSFLQGLTFLRGVDLFHWDVKDISVLKKLPHLEAVRLECQFKAFDFSIFSQVRLLSVRWRPGCESLFACSSLELLFVNGYAEQSLQPLQRLSRLRRLFLKSRKLESLAGIEQLPQLQQLELVDCTVLSDIQALSAGQELRRVEFTACRKVGTLEPLRGLPHLERLLLENCGTIASVRPLGHCDRLAELYLIGTTVEDGDLRPLLELKSLRKVAIADSAKHSHTTEQLRAVLSSGDRPPPRPG
jgi:Leucine-rich repeat (LRR) protein